MKNKNKYFTQLWRVYLVVGLVICVGNVQATTIKILGDNYFTSNDLFLNDFYNSRIGFASSLITGNVTATNLSGVDLFVAVNPADDFTTAEIAAMSGYLVGGGRILFVGELGIPNFIPRNNSINRALSALGSSIALINDSLDGGQAIASVRDGQIEPHPFTADMSLDFIYAGISTLSGIPSGHEIIESENRPGNFFAGFAPVGGRGIVVIGDSSWLGFVNNRSFSNGQFALNIALVNVPGQVPEPSTLVLLAFGLFIAAGFGLARRQRVRRSPGAIAIAYCAVCLFNTQA